MYGGWCQGYFSLSVWFRIGNDVGFWDGRKLMALRSAHLVTMEDMDPCDKVALWRVVGIVRVDSVFTWSLELGLFPSPYSHSIVPGGLLVMS